MKPADNKQDHRVILKQQISIMARQANGGVNGSMVRMHASHSKYYSYVHKPETENGQMANLPAIETIGM